jgi:hypothetical protein
MPLSGASPKRTALASGCEAQGSLQYEIPHLIAVSTYP